MTIQAFPVGIIPSQFDLNLFFNAVQFKSAMNGATQTELLPGALWAADIRFDYLAGDEVKKMRAFLVRLQGGYNPFLISAFNDTQLGMSDFIAKEESDPTVDKTVYLDADASSFDTTITVNNLLTGTIPAGTYFNIGTSSAKYTELKVTTEDSSISGGKADLVFQPPLRNDYNEGDTLITFVNPKIRMRLIDSVQGKLSYSASLVINLNLQAIEYIL